MEAAKNLIQFLRERGPSAPYSDSREEWTQWIKSNLYGLISSDRWVISPLSKTSTKGEYLTLDICVEERQFPRRILLAVESELDSGRNRLGEVLEDFEKLLAVKSAFKLMIFSSERNGVTNEVLVNGLNSDLEGYGHNLRSETYIFVDYNEDSGENGSFICHIWQSTSNGPQNPVEPILAK
jgi:hypothetical protein